MNVVKNPLPPGGGKSANQKVDRILHDAGVDAADMDPLSLQALHELVVSSVSAASAVQDDDEALLEQEQQSVDTVSLPPLPQITSFAPGSRAVVQRVVSDLTTDVAAASVAAGAGNHHHRHRHPRYFETSTEASTAGGSEQMTTEERLLKTLDEQTQLILDLHFRMDELQATVVSLSHQSQSQMAPSFSSGNQQQQQLHHPQAFFPPRGLNMLPHPVYGGAQPQLQPQQQPQPQQQQQHRNMLVFPILAALVNAILDIPRRVRESRIAKIVTLFLELQRRQVRVVNIDLALVFKVILMSAILLGRMSHRRGHQHHDDSDDDEDDDVVLDPFDLLWAYRIYIIGTLILTGFFIQSGYIQFCYNFFVKEDYPARIWNGEEIDAAAVQAQAALNNNAARVANQQRAAGQQPPRRPPAGAAAGGGGAGAAGAALAENAAPQAGDANANDAANADAVMDNRPPWQRAIFRGQIPRQDEHLQRALPAPIRVVVETLLLIGSFFLSILPMWTPAAAVAAAALPRAQAQEQHQEGNHNEEEVDEDEDDDNGLPDLRPPVDPAEYEEDD